MLTLSINQSVNATNQLLLRDKKKKYSQYRVFAIAFYLKTKKEFKVIQAGVRLDK